MTLKGHYALCFKLIICVITFELVQPMCLRYLNVTDRQTDGQTDGRLAIAIPRFALRVSRGKKNDAMLICIDSYTEKSKNDIRYYDFTAR